MRPIPFLRAIVAVLGALPAAAQPPLPPHDARACADPPQGSAAATALQLAKDALAKNDRAAADQALLAVLARHPFAPTALRLAVAAAAGDKDREAVRVHELAMALADEKGQSTLDPKRKGDPKAKPGPDELERALGLCRARAEAIAELAQLARGTKGAPQPGQTVLLDLALLLADEATRGMPKLRSLAARELVPARTRLEPDYALVRKELLAAIQDAQKALAPPDARPAGPKPGPAPASRPGSATGGGDPLAVVQRASRCLVGLSRQLAQSDLQGPRPGKPEEWAGPGLLAAEQARELVGERCGAPATLAALLAMNDAERARFSLEHARWSNPGRALSATGKYLIETTCGHAVLVGVAGSIELHHDRLVDWNGGKDPFGEQRGIVRVVPESDELTAEGSPYWWAGGFQSGPVTRVICRWNTVPELGRVLTHELCHRFDGALHAFLPAWASEGRAVWVAGAYGNAEEPRFVANHLDPRVLEEAYLAEYGRKDQLEKLLSGTIKDYRDNYTAGAALWCYMASWTTDDGLPLYAEALERWLDTLRAGQKEPLAHFTRCFADGKQGRPSDLDAFSRRFAEFLRGGYDRAFRREVKWLERYRVTGPPASIAPLFPESANYSWTRDVAEPWFGQAHAADAGRLLAELGRPAGAAAALLWARDVDPCDPEDARRLAALLDGLGKAPAAAAVRALAARRMAQASSEPGAALCALLPRCRALLDALEAGAKSAGGSGCQTLAARLAREAAALGTLLAVRAVPAPATGAVTLPLSTFGLVEDGLVGFERKRVAGLWFETGDGDLHVGRARPRDQTGTLDRDAQQRDAFVRSAHAPSGEYVFRTRVHATTSYVRGEIVLGWERRDRCIRIDFSAGDFEYSIGNKADGHQLSEVALSVHGPWSREQHLTGFAAETTKKLAKGNGSFLLEVHVRGPALSLAIDGETVLRYATPDGSAISGAIGCAMGQGAVRLQEPVVELVGLGDVVAGGFDLAAAQSLGFRAGLQQRVLGMAPEPGGTALLYVPKSLTRSRPEGSPEGLTEAELGQALEPLVQSMQGSQDLACRLVVALPESRKPDLGPVAAKALTALGGRAGVVYHAVAAPQEDTAMLGFVDGLGFLRVALNLEPGMGLFGRVGTWGRRWRPQ